MMDNIVVEHAHNSDFEAIWPIIHQVIQGKDTYVFVADSSQDAMKEYWMAKDAFTYVARISGEIAGTYVLRANRPGYGSHVANASFMVNPQYAGRGIGRTMGKHCLNEAKCKGFLAIQFNFVVSTNTAAVNLWKSLGFAVIGTIPQGFNHGTLGLVDALIMHRFL